MRKLILMGRSESGKSTLIQALRHEEIHYHKTQYIDYRESIIDTPGEYIEEKQLGGALAVYSCEADIIGILISATEPFCLFPPNVAATTMLFPNVPKAGFVFAAVNAFSLPALTTMTVFRKFLIIWHLKKSLKINKL